MLEVGQQVDWIERNTNRQREFWHGVITRIEGSQVHVLWLLSNTKRSAPLAPNTHPHHFGYATVEVKSALRACSDGLTCSGDVGNLHPRTNFWGRRFGVASVDAS